MNKSKNLAHAAGAVLAVALLTILDQITKYAAQSSLMEHGPLVLIKGVFELHYLENRGAAFGTFQNQQWLFILCVLIVLVVIGWCYYKLLNEKKYLPLRLIAIFVTAGAIGNMIDRIRLKYVVDFFYFSLINFPIFNVADIYVTVSAFALIILILTVYKDDDFGFLNPFSKKENR